MAEPRRIAFETVKPNQKDKKQKRKTPTLRFTLRLCESNEKSYSEYSYSELLKSVSKKVEENGERDPFGDSMDDNDAMIAMAKKLEDKYGPKLSRKKRQEHWEDFVDKGLGYDETDPFIDNDEAYDELVPSSITTQHGGFYINLGELEFRAVSSDSEPFPYDPTKKRKKKRKMKDLLEKAKRKQLASMMDDDNLRPKKKGKKLLDASANRVENTLQAEAKKKIKVTTSDPLEENPPTSPSVAPNNNVSAASANNIGQNSDDSDFEVAKDTSFVASCMSDIEAENEEIEVKNPSDPPQDIPKLPLHLSTDLDSCINKLKQAASTSAEGKCKFFSNDVNDMLLNVELKSRQLSKSHRSMIYSHLASHLPCTKETLQKRAKKLTLDQEDVKLQKPLEKLREVIARAMPAQKEKYAVQCKVVATELAAEKAENKETKRENEEDDKKSRLPRRKFAWGTEIRSLLCEVVSVKLKCFEMMKVRTQTVEEFLRQFFDQEIKELWPTGWMNSRILLRESKPVYAHLSKAKKAPTMQKKVIPGASVGNAPVCSLTNSTPSVIPVKAESAVLTPTTSPLSSIKNTSLSQFSETAALPSINKLIQQTKISSFPAMAPLSSIGVVNSLIGSPESVNCVPKTAESAANLSLSILSPTHKSSPEPKPPSSMSIKPVSVKGESDKLLETSQVKQQLSKHNIFVSEAQKPVSFNKPVKTKPDLVKSPIDLISTAGTRPSMTKPSLLQPSLMSVITSTSMSSLHKDPPVSKESTAFDVLDQIINASLGNFSSNKAESEMFSSGPNKLVDNALMDLINSQPKNQPIANQPHNPPRTFHSESLPHSSVLSHQVPVVSIVKTSPTQGLPNGGKSHARLNSNSETYKSTIHSTNDNLMKPYAKFLNDISHSQPLSVTPVQTLPKNRQTVSSSPSSLSAVHSTPSTCSSLADPAANLRSSYGFHEAFLNSLSGNTPQPPESQNVMRYPKTPSNKNIGLPTSNAQLSSGIMKKQDFFSHNRPVSYSHPSEEVPVSANAYVQSTLSRTSPQSVDKLKNSVRHHNTLPKQTAAEIVHSTTTEAISNIVNLAIENPQKMPATSVASYASTKNFLQSANDFSQDRLVSGLLHHASFANEKLSPSNFNIPKSSIKPDNFLTEKPLSQPGHSDKDLSRNSTPHPSIHHTQHKRNEDLISQSTSNLVNKPVITSTCNNTLPAPTFKLPSSQTSPHQNFHPQSKSPSIQQNQSSPPFNKFAAAHLAKPYTLPQHQPVSGLQNQVILQSSGNRLYQTSPTPSAPALHSVPTSPMPPNSPVYSQIPNVYSPQTPQVTSPQHTIMSPPVVSSPYNSQNISGYTQHSPSHRQV